VKHKPTGWRKILKDGNGWKLDARVKTLKLIPIRVIMIKM
jgi:hypothetical protein